MPVKISPDLQSTHPATYFLLACTVLANIAWFSDRAVFIDENLFLGVARMTREMGILASGDWLFFGGYTPLAAHTHSPFGEYCLALLFALFGKFDEQLFRLTFGSVFSILAAVSFYWIARRESRHPTLLTLLFISSPSFFVFSPTLMMDIPMLALLLLGLHWFLDDSDSAARRGGAALCFTISVAFGYVALVPLACLLGAALWTRRPARDLMVIATPFFALGVWAVALTAYYGELPFVRTARHFASVGSVTRNMVATPSFLGGVAVFPWLFVLVSGAESRRAHLRAAVVSVVAAVLLSVFVGWITYRYGIWYIFLASAGLFLILLFGRELPALLQSRRTFQTFLALAFPAVLLFFIVVGEFISARYVLIAVPWLYLSVLSKVERKPLALLLAGTLLLSMAIATADYRFVNAYRDWVTDNVTSVQTSGIPIWNSGESGLRFYMEQQGAPTLSNVDPRPQGGDLIVRQKMFRYSLPERIETMLVTLKTWELNDRFPLRTFNQEGGAGFHGSGLGLVPFAVSRRPYDVLEFAQITPLAQTSPAAMWSEDGPILDQKDARISVPMKLPPRTRVEYELQGKGSVRIEDGHVTLEKGQEASIRWRNFRFVPSALSQ